MTHATFATGMTGILEDFSTHADALQWCKDYLFLRGGVAFVLTRGGEDDFWQIMEVVK